MAPLHAAAAGHSEFGRRRIVEMTDFWPDTVLDLDVHIDTARIYSEIDQFT